jgi:hypothetical protein
MQISIRVNEQICNYPIMVNAFLRAPVSRGRSGPDRTGSFGGSEAQARVPDQVRGDVSVKRWTHSGLGTSTLNSARIPVSSAKINNKIKMFAPANKHFLTISAENLPVNECCEPER